MLTPRHITLPTTPVAIFAAPVVVRNRVRAAVPTSFGSRLVPRRLTPPVVAAPVEQPVRVDVIQVPFFKNAADPVPVVVVAAPKPQSTPTWPCPNVVRGYILGGKAKFRLTLGSGRELEYMVRGTRRDTGAVDFYVFIHRNEVSYGDDHSYLGMISGRDNVFRTTKATDTEALVDARFFGDWWNRLCECEHTTGIAVSCRESRAAERKAATIARKAAEQLAKLTASIAHAAGQVADRNPPTADQVEAIKAALQVLRRCDQDRASLRNKIGFNVADSYHGHHLADLAQLSETAAIVARDLVRKYRGQIHPHLLTVIFGGQI